MYSWNKKVNDATTFLSMDLATLFNSKIHAMPIIEDLQKELIKMEDRAPQNVIHPSCGSSNDSEAKVLADKPRTISEFRRSCKEQKESHGVAGTEVLNIGASAPLYEIQYVLLFAIYVSQNLRNAIAVASPKPVGTWLKHMRFYFERHCTCMHEQNSPHKTLLGTQGVVEYVMHTRLQIQKLYTA